MSYFFQNLCTNVTLPDGVKTSPPIPVLLIKLLEFETGRGREGNNILMHQVVHDTLTAAAASSVGLDKVFLFGY